MDSAGISAAFSTVLHNAEAVRFLPVRQLLPDPIADVDPLTLYPLDSRPAICPEWLTANLCSTEESKSASVSGGSFINKSVLIRMVHEHVFT